jgi:small subunit ribosomal protein S16|tara:strand:- start:1504 stop:1743 length:240 start_codon:yes stop_codon:yes gene_type:complete
MLKLRLQRTGRKKKPTYRVVVIEHSRRRNGKPVEYLGYYNPLTKESYFDVERTKKWLAHGAKPSPTVLSLFSKSKIINN